MVMMSIHHAFRRRPRCFLFIPQGTSTARSIAASIKKRSCFDYLPSQQQQHVCYYSSSSIIQQQQQQHYNPGLSSVISQGINGLETTAAQIEVKTRRHSLDDKKLRNVVSAVGVNSSSSSSTNYNPNSRSSSSSNDDDEDNIRQLAEGHRIMTIITECLEDMCNSNNNNSNNESRHDYSSLIYNDEPITIVDVHVNSDLKHARIYWTLPYSILMDQRIYTSKHIYDTIISKLNTKVSTRGQKLLQRHVHHKLRFYYPPKLRLLPATDDMVKQVLEEILSV